MEYTKISGAISSIWGKETQILYGGECHEMNEEKKGRLAGICT